MKLKKIEDIPASDLGRRIVWLIIDKYGATQNEEEINEIVCLAKSMAAGIDSFMNKSGDI
jgi:hypothetical protein